MRMLGLVLVGAVALGACGAAEEDAAGATTTSTTSTTTSSSPSSSATTTSATTPAEDPELAAAEAKALEFQDLVTTLTTKPEEPLEAIDTVARGEASEQSKHSLAQLRVDGVVAEGRYTLEDVETESRDGSRPTAVVRACFDMSEYTVSMSDGTRLERVKPGDTVRTTFVVEHWDGDGWFVTKHVIRQAEC